ncbi:hypothetical protein CERZMDRAFT_83504 [Cercospora zeae-maydis SCOH1-5]|uniref:Uncharacterized protein n=1 Tax=Cercospora zeae-maydis SCOH1-5 TaxID=717836 RepID=A0A6A6FL71_9PEZI|nr:hypothetical protein CERZMDRAFT_83504 [Cercospora zeae-maydis SCOH1-5]
MRGAGVAQGDTASGHYCTTDVTEQMVLYRVAEAAETGRRSNKAQTRPRPLHGAMAIPDDDDDDDDDDSISWSPGICRPAWRGTREAHENAAAWNSRRGFQTTQRVRVMECMLACRNKRKECCGKDAVCLLPVSSAASAGGKAGPVRPTAPRHLPCTPHTWLRLQILLHAADVNRYHVRQFSSRHREQHVWQARLYHHASGRPACTRAAPFVSLSCTPPPPPPPPPPPLLLLLLPADDGRW